jgi:hypothetical protein
LCSTPGDADASNAQMAREQTADRSMSGALRIARRPGPTSLQFFSCLSWLDGKPLLDSIEPYRRELFTKALDTYRPDGSPAYNLILAGRGKKNAKSLDLILAALFVLVIRRSAQGSDGFILGNDQDQAADDLSLAKKLVAYNPDLAAEIEPFATELRLRDGSASLKILPAKDAIGAHGKSAAIVCFDEIHGYRDWSLMEALQPDPTRSDALQWVTSYASIYNTVGAPLHDLMAIGKAGTDPRMLFSWYSGDYTSDPAFADLDPEERANPSMASWPDGRGYLDQQRRRLPTSKYRRLHLNLPGSPTGAFLDQGAVLSAIVPGRRSLPFVSGKTYRAGVDMSGGSIDDAVLGIAHKEDRRVVVDLVEKQAGGTPFNPRDAVRKFAGILVNNYKINTVFGDAYAGETFRLDFLEQGVVYKVTDLDTTALYEAFEPRLNAGEIELPVLPVLTEQLLTLVQKGARVTHENGAHDDWANACACAVWAVSSSLGFKIPQAAQIKAHQPD